MVSTLLFQESQDRSSSHLRVAGVVDKSVKVVPCTDATTMNNLETEIPDKGTLQAVRGDGKVTRCPQGGKIFDHMTNILAHLMVAREVITDKALRIATAAELNQVKVRGHDTSITGVRILVTLMIVAKGYTILGMDNQDRISPEVAIKGHIRPRETFKGHSLPIKEQGHTMNFVSKSQGHIIPQGMIEQMQSLSTATTGT